MAERYKRIFELNSALYADSAPLIISAGALLEDKLAHSTLVQLKMQSISPAEISAVTVMITPLSPSGEELEKITYLYKSLKLHRDQYFGQKTAIIADSRTSSFQVSVTQVVFSDGSLWDGTESAWTAVKAPKTMEAAYDAQLSVQFSIRYGNDCHYLPQDDRGLWFCACGLINREEESKCHGCRRVYSALKNVNYAALRSESQQRQKNESQQEEKNQTLQKGKNKKRLILSAVLLPFLLLSVYAFATIPQRIARQEAYDAAALLLQSGKYEQAKAAFAALGDYEDSFEQAAKNVDYEKGRYILHSAQTENMDAFLLLGMKRSDLEADETVSVALYKAAEEIFSHLSGYKDSDTLRETAVAAIENHYAAIRQASYDHALSLLEEGCYLQAHDSFSAIGEYKDAPTLALESLYRRAAALTEFAGRYTMKGVYSRISRDASEKSLFYITKDAFAQLGPNMSTELRELLRSDGVEIKIEEAPDTSFLPICRDIGSLFEELGTYKDSPALIVKLTELGDFTKPFYELCGQGKLLEAYHWLEAYQEEFPARDQWISVLQTYIPYCGIWELSRGDPTLIPLTVGVDLKCTSFHSFVTINDYVIMLRLYINGSTEQYIDLPVAAEGGRFSCSHDGINTYIAALGNNGKFNYSQYNAYSLLPQGGSCEYARVG